MVHVHRPLSTRISANLRLARTLDTAVRGLNSLGDGFFRPSSRCRPLLSSPFLCSMPNAASVQHSSMSCAKSLEVAALLTLPALRCAFAGHGVRRVFRLPCAARFSCKARRCLRDEVSLEEMPRTRSSLALARELRARIWGLNGGLRSFC